MKGTISEVAAKILRDPAARKQLDEAIYNKSGNSVVSVDNKTYEVRRTGETTINTKPEPVPANR